MKARFWLALLLVIVGVVYRVVPHPWNFAPVGAIALFAGATFERRWTAVVIPLVTMFIGDLFVGLHALMPLLYATYALIAVLGMLLRERRTSPVAIGGGALASATIFFVLSNFGMWALGMYYPRTWDGLVTCFVNAIPYFGNTLASDLIFSACLFGLFHVGQTLLPAARAGVSESQ
ncbi:MAG TPA: DUF6580 family putative transport protein [Thermoanaerobaculia bacterium]